MARDEARLEARAEELRAAHGVEVEVLAADLSDRAQVQRVADRLASADRPVDLLVNNAGFGIRTPFTRSEVADEERMLDVLVRAVLVLSHAAANAMRERGHGAIVNVSSVAGFAAMGSYSAAKAWVTTFTEALAQELAGSGVRVQALCPGFTRTEFHQRGGMKMTGMPDLAWLDADELVATSLRDLRRGRVVSIPSARYKVVGAVLRHAPKPLVRRGRAASARAAGAEAAARDALGSVPVNSAPAAPSDVAADRARLLELIRELAVVHGTVTLSSGKTAEYYVDLRRITLHHEAAPLVGRVVLDLLDRAGLAFDAVGGLTLGADPVAPRCCTPPPRGAGGSTRSSSARRARRTACSGGSRARTSPGRPVVAVEDTSTTGGSVLTAVEALREAGADVLGVAVIVDRGTGAREAVEAAGWATTTCSGWTSSASADLPAPARPGGRGPSDPAATSEPTIAITATAYPSALTQGIEYARWPR